MSGTLAVHVVRFLLFLFGIIALIFLAAGISALKGRFDRLKRRRRIKYVIEKMSGDSRVLEVLKDAYIQGGTRSLQIIQQVLTKPPDAFSSQLGHYLEGHRKSALREEIPDLEQVAAMAPHYFMGMYPGPLFRLADEGLITLAENKTISVNPNVASVLGDLLERLK